MKKETECTRCNLVVKAMGSREQIEDFICDLLKVYPRQRITYSHTFKNERTLGFHIFINILPPENGGSEQ